MMRCIAFTVTAAVLLGTPLLSANPVAVPVQERESRAKKQTTRNAEPRTIGSKVTITHKLKAPALTRKSANNCKATAELSYMQMNDRIRVDAVITSPECPASHGEYHLQVRTKDAEGEAHTRSFTEAWTITDGTNAKGRKFYEMAGDVELLRTRVHRITCTCEQDESVAQ